MPARVQLSFTLVWGPWGTAPAVQQKCNFTPTVSRKKGDMFVCPGYDSTSAIHPDLAKTHCDKYMVVGSYCPGFKQCDRSRHLHFFKWNNEDHAKQLYYVDHHKNTMMFNKHSVQNLPAKKQHLLRDPGAP